MKLKIGDMFFYGVNRATGVLLRTYLNPAGERSWDYSLRSPPRSNLAGMVIRVHAAREVAFLEALEQGLLEYYAIK